MKKRLYVDMDNTLVDFGARLEGIDPAIRERYRGREDEMPGLFALMPPMPGVLDAYGELSRLFDTYILDRPLHNGADRFTGEVIAFGSAAFPDWPVVTTYLRDRA